MANRKTQHIPIDKIAATLAAIPLIASETGLNAEHIAGAEGWASTLVAGVVGATLAAAVALPIAERAAGKGCWLKAAGLTVFFVTMLAFSFSTSVGRVGSQADGALAGARGHNARVALAREGYEAAKQSVEAECKTGRGPRCRAAEDAATAARTALAATPAAKAEDSMSRRLAAATGLSAAAVALYQPLLFPLALQLGGFFFLAYGLSPRRKEPKPPPAAKPKAKAKPKPKAKPAAREGDNIVDLRPRGQ